MNREHLSYVLGKLVCLLRREHSYGPKFKASALNIPHVFLKGYVKKCVICGRNLVVDAPVRRVERRTKD